MKQKFFVIDTETNHDTLSAEIVGISLCIGIGKAYIPIAHECDQPEHSDLKDTQLDRDIVLGRLQPLLADESILKSVTI